MFRAFTFQGRSIGVGFFASEDSSGTVTFPFEVDNTVYVGDSFETRDLWFLKDLLRPYYLLLVDKRGSRLFRGVMDSLEEIRKGGFPVLYQDDYEYQRSSLGSSYGYAMKGFEKDKGVLTSSRLKEMVRDSVELLPALLGASHAELIIAGPAKLSHEAAHSLPSPYSAAAILEHNRSSRNHDELSYAAWVKIQECRDQKTAALIDKVNDLALNNKVSGIRNVWAAARKGKGKMLLVDRTFRRSAYMPEGSDQIRLHPPKGKYSRIVDAVDDVIEMVRKMHGDVVFTEGGKLNQYEGIALTLRYS
jgi:hypothetical protein